MSAERNATLIGGIATAYQGLNPATAAELRNVFAGETSIDQTHRVAGLLIDTTPRDELQLVLTRLITMATETEADVMVHGNPGGFEPADAANPLRMLRKLMTSERIATFDPAAQEILKRALLDGASIDDRLAAASLLMDMADFWAIAEMEGRSNG